MCGGIIWPDALFARRALMKPDFDIASELREAMAIASRVPGLAEELDRLYADLQREIDARKPICQTSGRCCKFDSFGHRLYVTTIELAVFANRVGSAVRTTPQNDHGRSLPILSDAKSADACPFQEDKLCTVHTIRPFGCRIFFCDETSTDWQRENYERFHARLKGMHAQFQVPYLYMEWRSALAELK
jgi:Fe-S-cluster containining protein